MAEIATAQRGGKAGAFAEYQPKKIDEKAVQNMGFYNVDDLAQRLSKTNCLLAETQPCSKLPNSCHHPRDKFHVNYNSRRHVFSWAKLKMILGMDFPIRDDRLMKDIWKAFKATCSNGHRGNHKQYRPDGQVCINPTHFILDQPAAIKLNFSFPKDFEDHELSFSRQPLWQVTAVGDVFVFHRIDEACSHQMIVDRLAQAAQAIAKPTPVASLRILVSPVQTVPRIIKSTSSPTTSAAKTTSTTPPIPINTIPATPIRSPSTPAIQITPPSSTPRSSSSSSFVSDVNQDDSSDVVAIARTLLMLSSPQSPRPTIGPSPATPSLSMTELAGSPSRVTLSSSPVRFHPYNHSSK